MFNRYEKEIVLHCISRLEIADQRPDSKLWIVRSERKGLHIAPF